MIIILTIAIVKQIIIQTKDIAKWAVQATENTIKKASRNKLFQNIKDLHRTATLAITIATNMTNHTNHSGQDQINNRNVQNSPSTQNSTMNTTNRTSHSHPGPTVTVTTSTTSCSIVSAILCKDQARKRKHPNTKP